MYVHIFIALRSHKIINYKNIKRNLDTFHRKLDERKRKKKMVGKKADKIKIILIVGEKRGNC